MTTPVPTASRQRCVVLGVLLALQLACFPVAAAGPQRANFGAEAASAEARQLGNWVVDSNDSQGLPFVLVDKRESKVYVFDGQGQLRGAAAALLGLARGDESVPGIGERKISTIRPAERTTPAGRFVASVELSLQGEPILWVDYDAAIALHPVSAGAPKERRLQRLSSSTPLERRITYGCINVSGQFFDQVVLAAFKGSNGIVYVMPETRSAHALFGTYDVDASRVDAPAAATASASAAPTAFTAPTRAATAAAAPTQ